MARVAVDAKAPDFELADFRGQPVRLSDLTGRDGLHVVLVFNRGFT
jgi:peroxiredoxin